MYTPDESWVNVLILLFMSILLTESIILLLIITADDKIQKSIRRLICHQAIVFILLSISILGRSFLFFETCPANTKCLVAKIFGAWTEALTDWYVVLLILYALSLRDRAFLCGFITSKRARYAVVAFTWLLASAEVALTFGVFEESYDSICDKFSIQTLLARCVFNTVSISLLALLLLTYLIKTKLSAHVVVSARPSSVLAIRTMQDVHVAGTLSLVSAVSFVLYVPRMVTRLVHVTAADPDAMGIDVAVNVVSSFWHFNPTLLFIFLLARHRNLRVLFRQIICRKCLPYPEHVVKHHHHRPDNYDTVHACHEMVHDSTALAAIFINPRNREQMVRIEKLSGTVSETMAKTLRESLYNLPPPVESTAPTLGSTDPPCAPSPPPSSQK